MTSLAVPTNIGASAPPGTVGEFGPGSADAPTESASPPPLDETVLLEIAAEGAELWRVLARICRAIAQRERSPGLDPGREAPADLSR